MFDVMNYRRVSDAYDKDLQYCEDLTGFTAEDWITDIKPWAKESIDYYKDNCK